MLKYVNKARSWHDNLKQIQPSLPTSVLDPRMHLHGSGGNNSASEPFLSQAIDPDCARAGHNQVFYRITSPGGEEIIWQVIPSCIPNSAFPNRQYLEQAWNCDWLILLQNMTHKRSYVCCGTHNEVTLMKREARCSPLGLKRLGELLPLPSTKALATELEMVPSALWLPTAK